MQSVGLTPVVADAMKVIAKLRQESLETTVNDLLRSYALVFYNGQRDGLTSAREGFDKVLKELKEFKL